MRRSNSEVFEVLCGGGFLTGTQDHTQQKSDRDVTQCRQILRLSDHARAVRRPLGAIYACSSQQERCGSASQSVAGLIKPRKPRDETDRLFTSAVPIGRLHAARPW